MTPPGTAIQTLMDAAAKIEAKNADIKKVHRSRNNANDKRRAIGSCRNQRPLHALWVTAAGDELADLRRRIKAQLRRLIKEIGVRLVRDRIGERSYRIMLARIVFESGMACNVLIATPLRGNQYLAIDYFEPLDVVKIRDKEIVARAEAVMSLWEDEQESIKTKGKPMPLLKTFARS